MAVVAPALSGCWGTPKHLVPLSDEMLSLLAQKDLPQGGAMYVRIFKQERELEVWLQNPGGTYSFLKTYNICHWSGVLGPKEKEGDKQAPEGFYVVTAAQMNPNSSYYLSFNIGYPNAYDLAHERTGRHLMVHGGCLSAGCYAMTDESVEEIFALAREAFAAGQQDFPVHAFPFRMAPETLALYADSPWQDFWANLKEGYDFFEDNRVPPVVGVERGRYVFFAPDKVPERFVLATGDADPVQPRIITGWTY
jgi:murein L,D-transpeptidase YafK